IESGGKRQLILVRPNAVSSVDPETGKDYWSVPYQATNGCVIMSPVKWQNYLYVGGFNQQSLMVQLAADRPAAAVIGANQSQQGVSPVNVQPHIDDGTMYGVDGNGQLYGVELPSGKRLWGTAKPISERPSQSGTAFIVKQGDAGDRYWLFNDSGDL